MGTQAFQGFLCLGHGDFLARFFVVELERVGVIRAKAVTQLQHAPQHGLLQRPQGCEVAFHLRLVVFLFLQCFIQHGVFKPAGVGSQWAENLAQCLHKKLGPLAEAHKGFGQGSFIDRGQVCTLRDDEFGKWGKKMGKINEMQLRAWLKAGEPVAKGDGLGLTFTLSKAGTAAWVLRYQHGGKPKELTIGRYPDIPLAEARKLALAKRASVQQGVDVAGEKQRAAVQAARAWSFRKLTDDYFEKKGPDLAESTRHARLRQLEMYVFPKIGSTAAADVTPADIVDLIETTAIKSLHVARLVMVALREVFSHGIARHVITQTPCAHIKTKAIIGGRKDQRERVMLNDWWLQLGWAGC